MSNVVHIFVGSKRGAPMLAEQSVETLIDGGLTGDRYCEAKNRRSPDYQVTFIQMENIEAFTQAPGLPLAPEIPRRNIVPRPIRPTGLRGKRFTVRRARSEGSA